MNNLLKRNQLNIMLSKIETIYNKNFNREVKESFLYKNKVFVYGKEFTFLSNEFYNWESTNHVLAHLDLNFYDNFLFLDYNKEKINELIKSSEDNNVNYFKYNYNKDKIILEDLFIKKDIEKYFVKYIPFQTKYFKIFDDSIIIKNNKEMMMNLVDSNLTIAYNSLLYPISKIIGGSPPLNFFLEDIILNIDSNFVQNHLKNVFNKYINDINNNEEPPIFNDRFLKEKIYNEGYDSSIYLSHILYSSSIIKLLAENNQKTLVIGKEKMLKDIEKMCRLDKNIPSIKYLFRSYLLSDDELKNLENKTSNLDLKIKRMIKNDKSISIDLIKGLSNNRMLPEYFKLSKENYKNFEGENYYNAFLEKLAILSYLIDNRFLKYWACGNNYFVESFVIFKKLKLNIDLEKILEDYFIKEDKYRKVFHQIHNKEIEKILFYPGGGRMNKNIKSILKKRYNDNSIKNKFIIGKIQNKKQLKLLEVIYHKKIQEIILKSIEDGDENKDDIIALKNFEKGIYTKSTLLTIKNLMYKANLELGLLKFPKFLKKDFKILLYDKMKMINKNMEKKLKKQNISINYELDQIKEINDFCETKFIEIDIDKEEFNELKDEKDKSYKPLLIKNLENDEINMKSSQIFNKEDINNMKKNGALENDFDFEINDSGEFVPKDKSIFDNKNIREIIEKAKITPNDLENIYENMNNELRGQDLDKYE